MNIVREIYDFITGGSIASPVGLAVAALAAYLCVTRGAGPAAAGLAIVSTLALTLIASVLEGAR